MFIGTVHVPSPKMESSYCWIGCYFLCIFKVFCNMSGTRGSVRETPVTVKDIPNML